MMKPGEISRHRLDALEKMGVPLDDARAYLSAELELAQFLDSLPGAADAFLDGGKGCRYSDWRFDHRASNYLKLKLTIDWRKKKEAKERQARLDLELRRMQSQVANAQFRKELNDGTKRFKQELARARKPHFAYPPSFARYHPESWCYLEWPTKQEVEEWAGEHIQKRVPARIKELVSWSLSWESMALPMGRYEKLGVPCLRFDFALTLLVKATLEIKETLFRKEFHGYEYQIEQGAIDLGAIYLPRLDWNYQEGFAIPIALLAMMSEGELEADGIEVIKHGDGRTVFSVRRFDDEIVDVHDEFKRFIINVAKDNGLAEGLLRNGLIDEVVAQLITEKSKMPLIPKLPDECKDSKREEMKSILTGKTFGKKANDADKALDAVFDPLLDVQENIRRCLQYLRNL